MRKPDYEREGVTLLHGDCLDELRKLLSQSVQAVVTSPPYFALRSYLKADDPLKPLERGSEPSAEAFILSMVEVFREVRRVLRDDGVCFINLGDSYSSYGKWGGETTGKHVRGLHGATPRAKRNDEPGIGNLLNIPHRVAEALRADGWILRQTIVWAKKSPMPESVSGTRWERCRVKIANGRTPNNDRAFMHGCQGAKHSKSAYENILAKFMPCPGCPKCEPNGGFVLRRGQGRCCTAHEYIFVMVKSSKYFWDTVASAEKAIGGSPGNKSHRGADEYHNGDRHHRRSAGLAEMVAHETRIPRSVWTLSSEPTSVRHFATYPSELVRRCLVAACSPAGCCSECGEPYAPIVEKQRVRTRPGIDNKSWKHANGDDIGQRSSSHTNQDPARFRIITKTLGYRPTCKCDAPVGKQVVLDPFTGISTTGQTAIKLGHRYIGIDLNREYLDISAKRIFQPPRWWLRQQKPTAAKDKPCELQRSMF